MTTESSLGYWLVERGVTLPNKPDRQYRGLDRRPDVPGPDQDAELQAEGRTGLLEIRNRFWELEDRGELHQDPRVALRLRDDFNEEGVALEVVLADLITTPDIRELPSDLRSAYEQRLEQWSVERSHVDVPTQPIGIDVTYPFPTFHSAIRQPVLAEISPAFIDKLNEFGLFSEGEAANRAAELCNRKETSWRPFCPVAISLVGAAGSS